MTDARLERESVEAVRRRWGVPALGVGVALADGGFESLVVGARRRGSGDPALPEDRWHLGSCAKAMTAACYARLVERGDAQWDAPLVELFDDLSFCADLAVGDEDWEHVTIDDVLRHRAGFPANLDAEQMSAAWSDAREIREQRTEAVARVLGEPPRALGRFRYSNLGYIAAGAAIERIAAMPFEAALTQLVLDPLGITSHGFGAPEGLWGHRPLVTILDTGMGRGPALDPAEPESDNPAVMTPAGRLHLTMADWARFLRVFLDAPATEAPLLSADSVERIVSAGAHGGFPHGMGWASARSLDGASFGQQGSNTAWVATALLDAGRARAAMVLVNDGRTALLRHTARYAAELLRAEPVGN